MKVCMWLHVSVTELPQPAILVSLFYLIFPMEDFNNNEDLTLLMKKAGSSSTRIAETLPHGTFSPSH